jgi:hypothetical protein
LKTAPIATGEQYIIFPSRTLGMGGVSFALRDPLADPFRNPARGIWTAATHVFAGPTFYDISEEGRDAGAGTTISAGAIVRGHSVFGGGAFAVQQLDDPFESRSVLIGDGSLEQPRDNLYLNGLLGFVLPDGRTSVGIAAARFRLSSVDGITRLYPNSRGVRQDGGIIDLRAGMVHSFAADRWLEAVVVHDRVDIRHDVAYRDLRWHNPPARGPGNTDPEAFSRATHDRLEMNLDRTRTTGVHVGYVMPVDTGGWRMGIALTANWKDHPKIPNYELANIPRDPGYSHVFGIGIGFTQERERRTSAFDFAWYPARSHTWAEAAEPTPTSSGDVIPAGGRTVENRFRFSNLRMAFGNEYRFTDVALQFGLAVQVYSYALAQRNHVELFDRQLKESWVEWTPTWGLTLHAGSVQLRFNGRMVNKGFVALWREDATEVFAPAPVPGQDFLIAPAQPINLPDFRVFTTQFSIVVPFGARRELAHES